MKKVIRSLVLDEGTIEGHEQLKSYITSYNKSLFGTLEESNISMDESRIDIPQVSVEENAILISPYSEEEVRNVVFQMEHNKTPRPDDFSVDFYQIHGNYQA
jgi:hypothetical protein